MRRHVVLADAGYGSAREFRDGVREQGLHYLVGVQLVHKVWPPGSAPTPPPKVEGRMGRPRTGCVAEGVEPWSIEELVRQLPKEEWKTVRWREGSRSEQASRFAAMRVRTAERHMQQAAPSEEVWLLAEWPRARSDRRSSLSAPYRRTPL
nr:transposase [Corallococcus sicarius]